MDSKKYISIKERKDLILFPKILVIIGFFAVKVFVVSN